MSVLSDFEPLRPRRYPSPEACSGAPLQIDGVDAPADEPRVDLSTQPIEEIQSAPGGAEDEPLDIDQSDATSAFSAAEGELTADRAQWDDEEYGAAVRSEAIRFAAIACSRAFRHALAEDNALITTFVDDALRACGRSTHPTARLNPSDVMAYRPQRDVDVIAEDALERGEIIIETDAGRVTATLDERAAVLVEAAAHA